MAPIWHRRPTLADLQAMSTGTAIAHVGIEFMEVGDDWLTARIESRPESDDEDRHEPNRQNRRRFRRSGGH
jgi:hypothetical protein